MIEKEAISALTEYETKTFHFDLKKILMEKKYWSMEMELINFQYDLFPTYEVKYVPDLTPFENELLILDNEIRKHNESLLGSKGADEEFAKAMTEKRADIEFRMNERINVCEEINFIGSLKSHKRTINGISMILDIPSSIIPKLNEKITFIEYYKVNLIRSIQK